MTVNGHECSDCGIANIGFGCGCAAELDEWCAAMKRGFCAS